MLETTGLANPFNILNEIEKLRPLARLDSITTLVDAQNGPDLLEESDIARNQVKAADTILLNKCDLVSETELDALTETVRTLNKRANLSGPNTEPSIRARSTTPTSSRKTARESFLPP